LLARRRNLHTRVEHVLRIERVLHSPRDLEDLRARRACEQRGTQRTIARAPPRASPPSRAVRSDDVVEDDQATGRAIRRAERR
jgi:hypothetical protein